MVLSGMRRTKWYKKKIMNLVRLKKVSNMIKGNAMKDV